MRRFLLLASAGVSLALAGGLAAQQQPASPANPVIGPLSQIHPRSPGYAFPIDQQLVYQAEWKLWNAGSATITVTSTGQETRVSGTAESSGVVALLYPVHDRFQSVFDDRTFCSQSLVKHTEEGFHKRETLINFNYARHLSILDETNLKTGQVKHTEKTIPGCVTDVLAGIFYIASLPLTPDATYVFPLNDGGETVDVRAHVETREAIKTPAGPFNTIRVAPVAASGLVKERGRIWIWYSDDSRHIPVQMRAQMFWGTLTFSLLRVEKK